MSEENKYRNILLVGGKRHGESMEISKVFEPQVNIQLVANAFNKKGDETYTIHQMKSGDYIGVIDHSQALATQHAKYVEAITDLQGWTLDRADVLAAIEAVKE